MALTDSLYTVSSAIFNLLTTNKGALGVQDVFYGDQNLIPRTPALAVESGPKTRALAGVGPKGRTDNHFTIYIMVYCNKITDEQINRRDVEQLAEAIELKLHTDITLGGLVTHSYVTEIMPGYATRGKTLFRMARITWTGYTKTNII